MAPDELENGAQCCCNRFDCRLFVYQFSQFAFYLSLSLSVVSKSLAEPAASVAVSQLVLWQMCDPPRTRCVHHYVKNNGHVA